jgi:predicted nuclease with RNAse H fold
MIKRGLKTFPLSLPGMKTLTTRVIRLNKLISEKRYRTIEVHPTSRRRILSMPSKDWRAIQTIFRSMDLEGDVNNASLDHLPDRGNDSSFDSVPPLREPN